MSIPRSVTYPNELSGISGAISVLSTDIYASIVNSKSFKPNLQDVLRTCVPRTVVKTTCLPYLRPGYTAEAFATPLGLTQPAAITNFTLKNGDGAILRSE